MLICENISAQYDGNVIFSNLGFCLTKGSLISVVGRNGSGKTSLLKTMAGLSAPSTGNIYYNNQDIYKSNEGYFPDLNYIAHQNSLNKELSVLDNLCFLANMRQNSQLIMAAINYFGLYPIVDLSIYKLSAGWQRRVSLARLICCYAKIWILDEPETNLDHQGKILLRNLINTRIAQGGIVIISSHDETWLKDNMFKINMEDYERK